MSKALERLSILIELFKIYKEEGRALQSYTEEEIVSMTSRNRVSMRGPVFLDQVSVTRGKPSAGFGRYVERETLNFVIIMQSTTPRKYSYDLPLYKGVTTMAWYQYQTILMWRTNQPPVFMIHFQVKKNHYAAFAFVITKMPNIWRRLTAEYKIPIPKSPEPYKEVSFPIYFPDF